MPTTLFKSLFSAQTALILSITLLFSSCDNKQADPNDRENRQHSTQAPHSAQETQQQLKALTADANLDFLAQMTPHHKMAMMMADEALNKASNPKTKDFARLIKQQQAPEIQQLKSWQQQWYPQNPFSQSAAPPHAHAISLTGPDYDKQWTREMIRHHQDALTLSRQAINRNSRPEIKKLAQQILSTQTQEIHLLEAHLESLS